MEIAEKKLLVPDEKINLSIELRFKGRTKCDCGKTALYGFIYGKAIFCKGCSLKNMFDVKHKLCEFISDEGISCRIRACFNLSNLTKPKYCNTHKEKGMINIIDKKCEYIDDKGGYSCNTRPNFGFENSRPKFCSKHKEKGMINVKAKICAFINKNNIRCPTQPNYNFPNKTGGIYCSQHKKKGMINIHANLCNFTNKQGKKCLKMAQFNYMNEKCPIFCATHKQENMVDVKHKKCKFVDNEGNLCHIQPNFNFEGKSPEYCFKHKEKNMIDVKNKSCEVCNVISVRGKKVCNRCNPTKKRGEKEKEVFIHLLKKYGTDFTVINDRQNSDIIACSGRKYKPDILMDCGLFFIDVEIDEYQHNHESYHSDDTAYFNYCEDIRMINIAQSLTVSYEGLPTVFIRYNPDRFKKDGETIRFYRKKRLEKLDGLIEKLLKIPPKNPITVYKMFYDISEGENQYINEYKIPYILIPYVSEKNGKEEI